MSNAAPIENAQAASGGPRASLLAGRVDPKTAEVLVQGLRAAGVRVATTPTVWDAVVEMEHARGARCLFVAVDYFGRDEFRLIPLVRREWPETTIVALVGAGFAHQGRLAELVGADVVLGSIDEISAFVSSLAPGPPPAEPRHARVRPPYPAPAGNPPAAPKTDPAIRGPAGAATTSRAPAAGPAPPAAKAAGPVATSPALEALAAALLSRTADSQAKPPPPAPPAQNPPADLAGNDASMTGGRVIGTIEVTEEELRLLLGEDEGPEPRAGP
jgi:hypothetical protein